MALSLICTTMQKVTKTSVSLLRGGQSSSSTIYVQSLLKAALPVLDTSCNKEHNLRHVRGSSSGKNISVSSILFQDGLEIQELPILVRLLDKSMVPPVSQSYSYTGEQIQSMTEEDKNFQCLLQQCASVKDVFKLLEIPSERVTGHSASAALCRICELQKMNSDWDDLHSFIRTAVMKELNDTVTKDIDQLSTETLLSLVSCYMHTENFDQECKASINEIIEKRMVEDQFSLAQLCSLSDLLHMSDKRDTDLINSIWVYIGNHCQGAQEDSISRVLASLPASHKYLLKVVSKQVHKAWWKMNADEIVTCLNGLVKLNSLQFGMMADFSRWLYHNAHQVTEEELMQILAAFIHFRFSDSKFITAVERFVGVQRKTPSTDLLGLVMEYCRVRRYFSPTILDAAAHHFAQFGQTYSALQMFTVLRPFGQLNYLPKDCFQFLQQTEKMLHQRFAEFKPAHLVELICSFAFVQKIPLNFVEKVLMPSYLSQVKGYGNRYDDTDKWVQMLHTAVRLEAHGVRAPFIYKKQNRTLLRDNTSWMSNKKLVDTLQNMFGRSFIKGQSYAKYTDYELDAEMHLTKDGRPVPMNYPDGQPYSEAATRLAFLIMTPEHYCVNSGHLLGEFAMRHRHICKLGYTVIEVYDRQFMAMKRDQREKHMAKKLKKWLHADLQKNATR